MKVFEPIRNKFEFVLPLSLYFCFSVYFFTLSKTHLIGWGDDPAFNLWTFLHNWQSFDKHGIISIFLDDFWTTNIFFPQRLTLALSENQIIPAILTFPIWQFTQENVLTLNLFLYATNILAFASMYMWLVAIRLKPYAAWGALLFAASGWLQSHVAHYQNTYIFLFPLAMWSWERLRFAPSPARIAICAVAFSWGIGWNLYFQTMLNLIFSILCGVALCYRLLPRRRTGCLIFLVIAFQLPIAYRYFFISHMLGGIAVGDGAFRAFSASMVSFFTYENVEHVLSRYISFYPARTGSIESVGFLGLTWTCLLLYSLSIRKAFWFVLAALLSHWISLGPDFGLLHLAKSFPGISSLRAVGRFQILVAFFSIPAILIVLESVRKSRTSMLVPFLLAMVVLELAPISKPKAVVLGDQRVSADVNHLFKELVLDEPVLYLGQVDSTFQLISLEIGIKIYGGYSGRSFLNADVFNLWFKKTGFDQTGFMDLLSYVEPRWAITEKGTLPYKTVSNTNIASLAGCNWIRNTEYCLFKISAKSVSKIDLREDISWQKVQDPLGKEYSIFVAKKNGYLNYAQLGTCVLRRTIDVGLPFKITKVFPLRAEDIKGLHFFEGQEIFRVQAPSQVVFLLPNAIRPAWSYSLECAPVQAKT